MSEIAKLPKKDFSKIPEVIDMPNLIEIQKKSYEEFLQKDCLSEKRRNQGLQAIFNSIFPINDIRKNVTIEFVKFSFGEPKYDIQECQERGMTWGVPIKTTIRLVVRGDDEKKEVKEIKEQEIFICELPLMSEKGTFVINGAERVIVSQLHRSPGVIFDVDEEKTEVTAKYFYTARIIPYRGSWLEFEFDSNYCMYARIDKKRKILATTIIRALGYSTDEEILNLFYKTEKLSMENKDKISGKILSKNIYNDSKEILAKSNEKITAEVYDRLKSADVKSVETIIIEDEEKEASFSMHNTLLKDKTNSEDDALRDIYVRFRPAQPATKENVKTFFSDLFFNQKKYDLGKVGRYKLNKKLGLDVREDKRVLTKEDIIYSIRDLISLSEGKKEKDDIDHLGNRRVRSAGELVENQFRIGMVRMEKTIRERLFMSDIDNLVLNAIINTKPVIASIKEFFGSSQLSQFMDQTNPIAELTHKRRLSAIGPGGLNRERAGFEVRDVHYTHYGRICPIETPEGPNIGLIASLSTYAKINNLGFIETPYRKVNKGVVQDEVEYLTADVEDEYVIAPATVALTESNRIKEPLILVRNKGDFPLVSPQEVNYMEVSSMQIVSVAAALIPFLEHDDANRALMGSNMQRQAVPLLNTEVPLISTGIENKAALDSGAVVVAKRSGTVEYVDSERVVVVTEDGEIDTYKLIKYGGTNQDTCINQKPIVRKREKVTKGKVLADGASTDNGEIALGHNVLVAFMPWRGYNFEDAIIISEKLVKEDIFASVHIEEFQLDARDTKLGQEEITRDIPNINEDALKNLDENGIIKIGAEVEPGDILIGKVAPKGETELTPEEKFLRAIFGEKAKDVRDASLRAPSGIDGKVIAVKVFSRKERESKAKETEKKQKINKAAKETIELVEEELKEELQKTKKSDISTSNMEKEISFLKEKAKRKKIDIEEERKKAIERVEKGDELPPGVIKLVKVYVARKRIVSVGDKMAGRHGNKGVIAKIVPEEDMPYLEDGTRIEIILNPLGVPSRMNVGQILETHLGWAAKKMGYRAVTPVFNGAKEEEIKAALKEANLPTDGKVVLYDGMTGETFKERVTVGYIYMMKLLHLVDDKMHARSIGPYSLVTQQPLGGKAQFGGQRFGEMEVWALEAYGASHTLQEILTVKSDDVDGRTKMYEALVKGKNTPEPGLPESFNVLIKEMQSLGLDVSLLTSSEVEKLVARQKKEE